MLIPLPIDIPLQTAVGQQIMDDLTSMDIRIGTPWYTIFTSSGTYDYDRFPPFNGNNAAVASYTIQGAGTFTAKYQISPGTPAPNISEIRLELRWNGDLVPFTFFGHKLIPSNVRRCLMMTYRMNTNEKGFTLVEVIIVSVMLLLVLSSVYSLYTVNQRTAMTQDEVVDVQQNLRIATDTISREIRLAGFLISRMRQADLNARGATGAFAVPNGNIEQPVNSVSDNSANSATLPNTADAFPGQPARVHADVLALNSASPSTTFAKIWQKQVELLHHFNS